MSPGEAGPTRSGGAAGGSEIVSGGIRPTARRTDERGRIAVAEGLGLAVVAIWHGASCAQGVRRLGHCLLGERAPEDRAGVPVLWTPSGWVRGWETHPRARPWTSRRYDGAPFRGNAPTSSGPATIGSGSSGGRPGSVPSPRGISGTGTSR